VKTHGTLAYHANPAAAGGFRDGDTRPMWALKAAPYVLIRAKRLFPRAYPYLDGGIVLHATPEVGRDLQWLLERYPMKMNPETALQLGYDAEEHRRTERDVHAILTGARPHLPFQEPARPAREYQLVAADLALTTGSLLLADDVGLGKTMSALLLLRDPESLPALVVTLTHLPTQWVDELLKTLPLLRYHIVKRGEAYDLRDSHGMEPDVVIMPYSKLRGWGSHLAGTVRTVIFDEIQELRRPDSQKYMAAAQVAWAANRRVGTTATPVYNYGDEIHTVMEVLAPGRLGSRAEFLREWGGRSNVGFEGRHATVRDPAALGLYLRDEGLMLRRSRKDVGRELPEVIRVPYAIDTDADLLEQMIEDTFDLAELIVHKAGARKDIFRASGEFDWRMRQATGIAKAPHVAEFVRMLLESEHRVVLYGWHRAVYDIWVEALAEFRPALYTGTESPAQKQRSKDAFLDGDARILMMSLRAGAGLDGLQEACHVAVFGELDWAPAMHTQCIGRLHRDGQGEPVVAYFLVSDEGSDPVMAEVLQLKRQQAEPILDPDAPLFEPVPDVSDRIRQLARDVLDRRRKRGAA
jgi:SNF2 family DNA or RNA helicase